MSDSLSDEMLSQCIIAREKAFRDYFSDWNIRAAPLKHTSAPDDKSKPFEKIISGLYHVSSQLAPEHLLDFQTEYPLGRSASAARESKMHPKYYDHQWGDSSLEKNKYDAKVDAAYLINQVDLALLIGTEGFNATITIYSREKDDPEGEGGGTNNDVINQTRVPKLQNLTEKVVQSEILNDAYKEEKTFIDNLYTTVVGATEEFGKTIEKYQEQLQKSEEGKEVERLELLLQEAKKKLMDKKINMEDTIIQEREGIQKKLDKNRASLTLDFVSKRGNILAAHPGITRCQECLKSFTPIPRETLRGWERCSVAGCSSREKLCPDCSAIPCGRCHAPFCALHHNPHYTVCCVNWMSMCGHVDGDKALSLERGCCVREGCYICRTCEETGICDRCSEDGECRWCSNEEECYKPSKWSATEYERERKRQKTQIDSRNVSVCPPFERSFVTSDKWKKEQKAIHDKWVKKRLEQPTEQEFKWVEIELEHQADDISEQSSWLDSLRDGGYKEFPKWIKQERAAKEVIEIIISGYNDIVGCAFEEVSEQLCPCGECKRMEPRVRVERRMAKLEKNL